MSKQITKTANKKSKNASIGLKDNSSLNENNVMPVRISRVLNYIDSNYVRSNSGANFLVYNFRVNDLYDPDPLILSGSISGFKEIMQFYNYFRVKKLTVDLEIANNENFSLLWGIFFSQGNYLGTFPNRDSAINSLENGLSTGAKLLAAKGGMDRDKLECEIEMGRILGDYKQYTAEVGYTGTISSSPSLPLYMVLVVASPTGTAIVNGVTTHLKLKFHSDFFAKTNLNA